MSFDAKSALLPAGLPDLLPPKADHEAWLVDSAIRCFRSHGYERVKPPLAEYESTLLNGAGPMIERQTFRLMDPSSQRIMGLRADMTPQVSRIVRTRLAAEPRPLRLCYAGQVMRVSGSQRRPERQFGQVGAELVGAESAAADAEILLMAAEAVRAVGVSGLTVDLCLPRLAPAILDAAGVTGDKAAALAAAVASKDDGALSQHDGEEAGAFARLVRVIGPADTALPALADIPLRGEAAEARAHLEAVVALVRTGIPDLPLTVDPVEQKGFAYQSGLCFTLFARGVRGELGRGGRYRVAGGEPAAGVTLYMDSIDRAATPPPGVKRIYLPNGADAARAAALRDAGWATVAGLGPVADDAAEAARLRCSHVLRKDGPAALDR